MFCLKAPLKSVLRSFINIENEQIIETINKMLQKANNQIFLN